jgi:hypothetical protein
MIHGEEILHKFHFSVTFGPKKTIGWCFRHHPIEQEKKKKKSNLKTHFDRASAAFEAALIAKFAHKEKASAAAFIQTFRAGWVRDHLKIKTWALVGNADGKCVFVVAKRNRNPFVMVALIAVQNSIGDGFGKANQNVTMNIG